MRTKLSDSTDTALGYEASGKITDEEFAAFVDDFQAAIARHGQVGLLVHLPELPSLPRRLSSLTAPSVAVSTVMWLLPAY